MTAIDWASISAYVKEVGRARRGVTEPAADASLPAVDAQRVRWFRARATGLAERAHEGNLASVARGGLQDSAPRAALLALHARAEDVGPDAWQDPALAQIWLRWADYVVPRADLDVFTVGTLPRDPGWARALTDLGESVAEMLGDDGARPQDVVRALDGIPVPHFIRCANGSGHTCIRWDARTTRLLAKPPPVCDLEAARSELARRYLGWLGPSNPRSLARWAGVTRADADATFAALEDELAPVAVEGRARVVLAPDLAALLDAEPPDGVRFLPGMGDPYLWPDRLVAQAEPVIERPGVDRRVLNSLGGRVMVDGRLVGSWGRRQERLTIGLWDELPGTVTDAIAEEGLSLAQPIGRRIRIRWLER